MKKRYRERLDYALYKSKLGIYKNGKFWVVEECKNFTIYIKDGVAYEYKDNKFEKIPRKMYDCYYVLQASEYINNIEITDSYYYIKEDLTIGYVDSFITCRVDSHFKYKNVFINKALAEFIANKLKNYLIKLEI